jgi:hypothetical protein
VKYPGGWPGLAKPEILKSPKAKKRATGFPRIAGRWRYEPFLFTAVNLLDPSRIAPAGIFCEGPPLWIHSRDDQKCQWSFK